MVRLRDRLPRATVDTPSLEVFKARLGRALSILVEWEILFLGDLKVHSSPNHPVILRSSSSLLKRNLS